MWEPECGWEWCGRNERCGGSGSPDRVEVADVGAGVEEVARAAVAHRAERHLARVVVVVVRAVEVVVVVEAEEEEEVEDS